MGLDLGMDGLRKLVVGNLRQARGVEIPELHQSGTMGKAPAGMSQVEEGGLA